MTSKRTIRQVAVALMLLVAFLLQGTWALAGTTGGLSGTVRDESGKPVVGAAVKAVSASQVASTQTDATGHFVFLALAPDTYTVSVEKDQYAPVSVAGITIFADQTSTQAFVLQPVLKTIAKVTSTAAGALVKSSVGADLYNVNAASIQATTALGGGGNLNSAYSAISSVPGVNVMQGGSGWNQNTYVRGSQSFFTGFEYDGIPVNRAFDNYNASTESNTGLQELEVYTGGGPASNSSAGTSGFINQVIKTGTYPGYGTLEGGIGGPTFYHQAKVEAGGATPDRRFSYYVGLSGYNQDFRFLDNSNAANGLGAPGQVYSGYSTASVTPGWLGGGFNRGVFPMCTSTGDTPTSVTSTPAYMNYNAGWSAAFAGTPYPNANTCYDTYNPSFGNESSISDRENVVNFHFGIPRKNGLVDDVQLLWNASSMKTYFYSSPNDGGGPLTWAEAVTGADAANLVNTPANQASWSGFWGVPSGLPIYYDQPASYNLPFGTNIAPNGTPLPTSAYYQPSSPTDRAAFSALPNDGRDNFWNDQGIVKAQYTHELSSSAYVRAFAYTFFSDWTQAGPDGVYSDYSFGVGGPTDGAIAANYDLITHTAGGELQFADQLNSQHLLQLTGNYTTATVSRFNNTGYIYSGGGSPIGYIADNGGTWSCYNPTTGAAVGCYSSGYKSNAAVGPTGTAPAGTAAATNGAYWATLWSGPTNGSLNTVDPRFTQVSLSDQWRPNDRWLFNLALRYEGYLYELPDSATAGTQFYSQIESQYVCQNSQTGVLYTAPLAPGAPPPAPVIYGATCPSGYVHPPFTANSPSSYTISALSPRISATFTESPDTVWRASGGRFTEPPISASVQYLTNSGDDRTVWNATLPLGFDSPFHPIPEMSADQFDLSLERHVRGTDLSFKITPFYNFTNDYQEQAFIGPNFVTQAPVGVFRSEGVEMSLQKGDFSRDGLSGQISLTYTNAKVKYESILGPNQLTAVNAAIQQYNDLTSACAPGKATASVCGVGADGTSTGYAAPCYAPGGAPDPACAATSIANPYYNSKPQGLLDVNGWYSPADLGLSPSNNPTTTYFDTPWAGSLILNYRKKRFAVTPSIQIVQGSVYGGPMDINGVDPRTCAANQLTDGVVAAGSPAAQNCDYWSVGGLNGACGPPAPGTTSPCTVNSTTGIQSSELYIPNPQTGTFASLGQYRDPWLMVGNIAFSYDLSPRVTVNLTAANLFHTCFGGAKEPWTSTYPAGSNVCSYDTNGLYTSNFYNGTSSSDTAANGVAAYPWQKVSYAPGLGSDSGFLPSPFNIFVTVQVKL
ncbi:MAG TPA: TonB-dependent receptor [Alphaproteobacteria bacterium]|nr:TonB-dependent receptor [Alphaproteobacteria bacterium]